MKSTCIPIVPIRWREPMPRSFTPSPQEREIPQRLGRRFLRSCPGRASVRRRESFSGHGSGCTWSKAVLGASHAESTP